MILTPYSITMAIIWFTCFIAVADYLRRKTGFLLHYHVRALLAFLALCILRLFLPMEFPFTYVLEDPYFFPLLQRLLRFTLLEFGPTKLTVQPVLILIWLGGAVKCLIHECWAWRRDRERINTYYSVESPEAEDMLQELAAATRPRQQYRLIVTPDIAGPFTIGFFKPTILLSMTHLNKQTLPHFVAHEWQHVMNRDQLIKMLVKAISCVLWWNSFVRRLDDNLEQALEIRVDAALTDGKTAQETADYLASILSVSGNRSVPVAHGSWMMRGDTPEKAMKQRFEVVRQQNERKLKSAGQFVGIILSVFFLSYLVVWQPYFEVSPDEVEMPRVSAISMNGYIERQEDGALQFVYEYEGQTESMEISEEDLKYPPYNEMLIIDILGGT